MSSVISSHSPDAVRQAVSVLNAGGLVGLPTETVYGLAARADIDDAVASIFLAKGRPTGHPLILHISDISELDRYAVDVPPAALTLARHCWPGPLTLLLHKSNAVSHLVTGGRETVAIRIPANNCARQIIEQCGFALAAPSANLFGHVSPTTAQHVLNDLGDRVDLIVDEIIEYYILQTRKLRKNSGFGLGRRRTLRVGATTSGLYPPLESLESRNDSKKKFLHLLLLMQRWANGLGCAPGAFFFADELAPA